MLRVMVENVKWKSIEKNVDKLFCFTEKVYNINLKNKIILMIKSTLSLSK